MQNKPVKILCTKILKEHLLKSARQPDIEIECVPFITTKNNIQDALREQINELAQKSIYIIFTSSKAVQAVAAALQSQPCWKIFCLFGATKDEVGKHFTNSEIITKAPASAALAQEVIQRGITEVYFFCGNKRMDTIPEKLSAAGIMVHQFTVYQTVASPQKITGIYDGILFFSPSAVHSYFSINKAQPHEVYYSIGNTTAASIRQYADNKIVICDVPTPEEMINKIILNEKR